MIQLLLKNKKCISITSKNYNSNIFFTFCRMKKVYLCSSQRSQVRLELICPFNLQLGRLYIFLVVLCNYIALIKVCFSTAGLDEVRELWTAATTLQRPSTSRTKVSKNFNFM